MQSVASTAGANKPGKVGRASAGAQRRVGEEQAEKSRRPDGLYGGPNGLQGPPQWLAAHIIKKSGRTSDLVLVGRGTAGRAAAEPVGAGSRLQGYLPPLRRPTEPALPVATRRGPGPGPVAAPGRHRCLRHRPCNAAERRPTPRRIASNSRRCGSVVLVQVGLPAQDRRTTKPSHSPSAAPPTPDSLATPPWEGAADCSTQRSASSRLAGQGLQGLGEVRQAHQQADGVVVLQESRAQNATGPRTAGAASRPVSRRNTRHRSGSPGG